jgi:hypothetical protein
VLSFMCLRGQFTPDLAAQAGVNLSRSRSNVAVNR